MNTSPGLVDQRLAEAVAQARATAQSGREYVDQIIAASPGWAFSDVRYGPGHGGYGCTLSGGGKSVTVLRDKGSVEAVSVDAIEQLLEQHGIPRN